MGIVCLFGIVGIVAAVSVGSADDGILLVTPRRNAPNGVNVRSTPTLLQSRIIGGLPYGRRLRSQGNYNADWYRVTLPNGKSGFASAAWLNQVHPDDLAFKIHFIDVGSGDAAIISIGATDIVIDGGQNPAYFANYIRRRSLLRDNVELVILTQPKIDHYRGLSYLFASGRRHVLEFWDPGVSPCAGQSGYDNLLRRIRRSETTIRRPLYRCGQQKPTYENVPAVPEAQISVLYSGPCIRIDGDCESDMNNSSIVVRIRIGTTTLLFPGDIRGKGRTELANYKPRYVEELLLKNAAMLKADVIKVPHHGSETSSTIDFIKAVSPKYAIISADTKHFLPDDSVVMRMSKAGVRVLRTDVDRRRGNDHILCIKEPGRAIICNYEDILSE